MNDQADLNIRINAIQQEYVQQLAGVSNRAAALASELASCQERLRAAEAKIQELTPKPEPDPA